MLVTTRQHRSVLSEEAAVRIGMPDGELEFPRREGEPTRYDVVRVPELFIGASGQSPLVIA